jgi:hypothetical protein
MRLFEFRQYTLHPARRDELVALFAAELVAAQEACGMKILGQFHDLDRPDRFVWMRSFPDQVARTAALTRFYGGPVWARHRDAANATMIDWDDVHLLREAWPGSSMPSSGSGPLVSTIWSVDQGAVLDRAAFSGAVFVTAEVDNDFPALPVREGEPVIVQISRSPAALLPHPAVHLRLKPVDASSVW